MKDHEGAGRDALTMLETFQPGRLNELFEAAKGLGPIDARHVEQLSREEAGFDAWAHLQFLWAPKVGRDEILAGYSKVAKEDESGKRTPT